MKMRELGNGHWDKALMRNMVHLSTANNYEEAKDEWLATGNVWWVGNGETPDWVANTNHQAKCLCGHNIVYHFEILNTTNGVRECVGSDHINSYLIMRQIAQEKGIDISTITEQEVEDWKKKRVGSMKAEAWWKENGTSFDMMFEKVKEIDVWFNARIKSRWYNSKLRLMEETRELRKRAEGTYGNPDYHMASVVWRWNSENNPKAQFRTRGYPNDRLMQDLALLFIKSEPLIKELEAIKLTKKLAEEAYEERVRIQQEQRQARIESRRAREAEEQRIWNLPENVEKRRLADEERQRQREIYRAEQARKAEEFRLSKLKERKATFALKSEVFEDSCDYYGIPVYDETYAQNDWSFEFLADIKKQMISGRGLSDNQLNSLRNILEPATSKQITFLRDLAYEGSIENLTKGQAGYLINKHKYPESERHSDDN
jgi:hypothetical protein